MEIVMNDTDLIIGAELLEDNIQMCVYDSELKAPVAADTEKDKTLSENIKAVINKKNASSVASICVVVPDFTKDTLEIVKEELYNAGVANEQYQIISRIESFAYYAYSQKKELYQNGTVLMDYNASGIDVYRLYCNKIGDMQYILQEHTLSQPEGSTIEKASHSVTLYMTEYFKKHRASSVYLTGMGFDVDRLPDEFTKVLVAGRKAFVGQNLYVRGACFAALEYISPQVFGNVCLLTDGRIKADIETDISVSISAFILPSVRRHTLPNTCGDIYSNAAKHAPLTYKFCPTNAFLPATNTLVNSSGSLSTSNPIPVRYTLEALCFLKYSVIYKVTECEAFSIVLPSGWLNVCSCNMYCISPILLQYNLYTSIPEAL